MHIRAALFRPMEGLPPLPVQLAPTRRTSNASTWLLLISRRFKVDRQAETVHKCRGDSMLQCGMECTLYRCRNLRGRELDRLIIQQLSYRWRNMHCIHAARETPYMLALIPRSMAGWQFDRWLNVITLLAVCRTCRTCRICRTCCECSKF